MYILLQHRRQVIENGSPWTPGQTKGQAVTVKLETPVDTLQEAAVELVSFGHNVYVSQKGGTGKTKIIKEIMGREGPGIVVSPTVITAYNLGKDVWAMKYCTSLQTLVMHQALTS